MAFALLDNSDPVSEAQLQSWLATLAPEERHRADGLDNPQRKGEFVAARVLLQGLATNLLQKSGWVSSNPGERPVLTCADGTQFACSVAHSGGQILVGISPTGQVGVDVEKHRDRPMAALVDRYFSPSDRHQFHSRSTAQARRWFYRQWCAREALLKGEQHSNLYQLLRQPLTPAQVQRLWVGQTETLTIAILQQRDDAPQVWRATSQADGALQFHKPSPAWPLARLAELTGQ